MWFIEHGYDKIFIFEFDSFVQILYDIRILRTCKHYSFCHGVLPLEQDFDYERKS